MTSLCFFKPDYNDTVKDSFEFKTEVQRVYNGSEHRRQLREFPRRFVEFKLTLHNQDKQVFENWLAVYQSKPFYLPLWHEKSKLSALATSGSTTILLDTTASSFEAVGFALVYKDAQQYEIISTVAKTNTELTLSTALVGTWQAGVAVYPLLLARTDESVKPKRTSSNVLQVTLKCSAEDPVKAIDPVNFASSYQGFPVLDTRNNWTREITSEYNRQLESIDFEVFGRFIDDESGIPTLFLDFHFLLKTALERHAFIAQLMYLSGKWQQLWVPTGQHDFTVVADVAAGSMVVVVRYSGLSAYGIVEPRQTIKLTLKNGVVFYAKLLTVVDSGNNTETLTVYPAFTLSFTVANVLIMSYLLPMRLSADLITLECINERVAECSVTFQTVNTGNTGNTGNNGTAINCNELRELFPSTGEFVGWGEIDPNYKVTILAGENTTQTDNSYTISEGQWHHYQYAESSATLCSGILPPISVKAISFRTNNYIYEAEDGIYRYRLIVDLSYRDITNLSVAGWCAADNYVKLYVNNVLLAESSNNALYGETVQFTLDDSLLSGINTLDFVVTNAAYSGVFNPSYLMVNFNQRSIVNYV